MLTHTGVRTWPSDVRQIGQLILTNSKNAEGRCQTWGFWHVLVILRKHWSARNALRLVAEKVAPVGAEATKSCDSQI